MKELKPKSCSSVLLLIFLIFSLLLGALSLLPLLSKSLEGSSASPLEIILSLPFFSIGLTLFLLYKLVQQPSRPRLFISSEELRMGETEKFKWEFPRGAKSVKRLHIHLLGRESATEGAGSSSKTHKNTFADLVQVDQDDPTQLATGECEISVPLAPPSFQGHHNRIQWSLEVFVHPRWWFFRFKYAFTLVCLPPLPVKTFKPLEPYGGTPIQINEGRINFAPGEWITGLVSTQKDQEAELQLLWTTEGKGDKDSKVVQSQPVEAGLPTTFRFEIPADAPPSFSGQLVSLSWELKLQAKRRGLQLRGKQLARAHLIVSPTGEKLTAFPSKKLMSYAS
jgi:hypothetical protein